MDQRGIIISFILNLNEIIFQYVYIKLLKVFVSESKVCIFIWNIFIHVYFIGKRISYNKYYLWRL